MRKEVDIQAQIAMFAGLAKEKPAGAAAALQAIQLEILLDIRQLLLDRVKEASVR